jgi:uncharacterized protein YuzE
MKYDFEYDGESDVLSIYNYEKSHPEESVEINEYIVMDIDKNNKIIGLEIFDASAFFGAFNKEVDKKFLSNLKEIMIEQKEMRNNWFLVIALNSGNSVVYQPMPPLRKSEYISPLIAS